MNGCLAGLVSITAPCAYVTPDAALLIGVVAGVTVSEAPRLFDRLHLDDPVGATSVHLVHGIFGTICVGLFGIKGQSGLPQDGLFRGGGFAQLCSAAGGGRGGGCLLVRHLAGGLDGDRQGGRACGWRPSTRFDGLDLAEMGMEAYPTDGLLASAEEGAPASIIADTEPVSTT